MRMLGIKHDRAISLIGDSTPLKKCWSVEIVPIYGKLKLIFQITNPRNYGIWVLPHDNHSMAWSLIFIILPLNLLNLLNFPMCLSARYPVVPSNYWD